MPAKPSVSAIITTYNRADYLVEAVESVLAQTYRDFELIVADDGSTDDTAMRARRYGDRVRYLQATHSGRPEDARNAALAVAQGNLIAFLDDDDLWLPEKLALQAALFAKWPDCGLAYSNAQIFSDDGSLSPPALPPDQGGGDVFEALLADCFIHPSTVMVHRRFFDRFGLFTTRFFSQADYFFWLQVAAVAPVRYTPQPLVQVRQHPARVSATRDLRHYQSGIEVLQHVRENFPLSWRQGLIVRRTLSRWHSHLGLKLSETQPARARRHFLRSLALFPLQRRAWQALLAGTA